MASQQEAGDQEAVRLQITTTFIELTHRQFSRAMRPSRRPGSGGAATDNCNTTLLSITNGHRKEDRQPELRALRLASTRCCRAKDLCTAT
eukprot:1146525-Pelagomonas_calceolata.AAC.3